MNLSWEGEAWKAVQAAEALFKLPKFDWLGAVHGQNLFDPSEAMESLFRQALGSSSEFSANSDFGPEARAYRLHDSDGRKRNSYHPGRDDVPETKLTAPHEARRQGEDECALSISSPPEQNGIRQHLSDVVLRTGNNGHATPSYDTTGPQIARLVNGFSDLQAIPLARGLRHDLTSRTVRELQTPSVVPVRCPVAGDDSSYHLHDSDGRERNSSYPGQDGFPVTESTASHGVRRDVRRQDEDEAAPLIPALPEQNRIRQALNDVVLETGNAPSPATLSSETTTPRSTRLVTGFSDLQRLFHSVVADSQPKDKSFPSKVPASLTGTQTETDSKPTVPIPQPPHWDHMRDYECVTGRPEQGRVNAFGRIEEATRPSASYSAPLIFDHAGEDIFLDRLLDRWEERLREQAIRHLGFTGGLT